MAELVLELFSEEVPARMQTRAADDLKGLVTERLAAAELKFDTAEACAGPRRLTLVVDGLPETQPDVTEEKRGPRTDAPQKAIDGFLNANGLTLDRCEKRETGRGEFWFAVIERKGRATIDLLPALLADAIGALPWPKSMRWGTRAMRWVRPLQRVLCVLDGDVVALELEDGIAAGNLTSGHRFHAPEEFEVAYFKDYSAALYRNRVIVDAADRRRVIEDGAAELAAAEQLEVRHDPALLAEVAGLVEWPVPLIGTIDARFMTLPDEVLTTSMRNHQKYFALLAPDGRLAPRFIVVANVETADGGKQVVAGNERVLRARLADAAFFWNLDRKVSLESRVPALADITFHARLGTVADKVARIEALAAELAPYIPGCDRDLARSAATLCKADLVTGMVGEFPELQGVMGRYYALEEGKKPEVAEAIAAHYSPAGPGDDCPTAPVSVAVALADRIDTLVGFWSFDEKPTGSKDPYALRRAALGVIRIILENNLRLPLLPVFQAAFKPFGLMHDLNSDAEFDYNQYLTDLLFEEYDKDRDDEEMWKNLEIGWDRHFVYEAVSIAGSKNSVSLLEFFADRLKVHLREKGVRHDLIAAVFALGGEDDLVRLMARVEALGRFLETEEGADLLTAYKRASNIVAIEEKTDSADYGGAVDETLLSEADETALFAVLGELTARFAPVLAEERFNDAMAMLSGLRGPVDEFFDNVTVNTDDAGVRANRLRLLSQIRATMGAVADFSEIEGGER